MKWSSEEIGRLRSAFAEPADGSETPTGCPEAERIGRAVRGELASEDLAEILDHVASCPSCTEDWRLGEELFGDDSESAKPQASNVWRPPQTWGQLSAAAVALLAVGLGWWRLGPDADRYRRDETPPIESRLPEPALLTSTDAILRWSGPRGARYDLLVMTEQLDLVFEATDLEVTEQRIPARDLEALPPGTRVLWRVEAILAGGQRIASATFEAHLEEESEIQ